MSTTTATAATAAAANETNELSYRLAAASAAALGETVAVVSRVPGGGNVSLPRD